VVQQVLQQAPIVLVPVVVAAASANLTTSVAVARLHPQPVDQQGPLPVVQGSPALQQAPRLVLVPVVAASSNLTGTTSAVTRLPPQQVDQQGPLRVVQQQAQLALGHEENHLPPVVAACAIATSTSSVVASLLPQQVDQQQAPAATTKSSVGTTTPRTKLNRHGKEAKAIMKYTKGSNSINKALRDGPVDASTEKSIEIMIRSLDMLPPFVGTVYRGTNLPESVVDHIKTFKTFSDKAFLSTSKRHFDDFFKFKCETCLFTITSRTGRDISEYASGMFKGDKGEAEVRFKPYTQFRVTSVEERRRRETVKYTISPWRKLSTLTTSTTPPTKTWKRTRSRHAALSKRFKTSTNGQVLHYHVLEGNIIMANTIDLLYETVMYVGSEDPYSV
jgi:ADP-ribosyltransferase exoenzyme